MSKKSARILSAALLMPILLFAVAGTSWAAWRCQYDGIARSACCCPKTDGTEVQQLAIASRDCCDVERTELEKAPSEPSRAQVTADPVLLTAPVGGVSVVEHLAPVRPLLRLSDQGPRGGRFVILQKQSFLI